MEFNIIGQTEDIDMLKKNLIVSISVISEYAMTEECPDALSCIHLLAEILKQIISVTPSQLESIKSAADNL